MEYYRANLQHQNTYESTQFYVHVLVADMFLCNEQRSLENEINHLNLNTLDNHVLNLEWCTKQEHNAPMNGLAIKAIKDGNSKIFKALKPAVLELKCESYIDLVERIENNMRTPSGHQES